MGSERIGKFLKNRRQLKEVIKVMEYKSKLANNIKEDTKYFFSYIKCN